MTRKQRRMILIGSALGVLAIAAALVLNAMRGSIVFFNSPTDVVEKATKPGERIRLGGLVKEGSVARGENLEVRFEVTDGRNSVKVTYQGLLPDLFREGQGVVTEGALDSSGILQGGQRARQARRDLHAEGSRRRSEETRTLEGRLGPRRWNLRRDSHDECSPSHSPHDVPQRLR